MNSENDNYEVIYCEYEGEKRVFCQIRDKLSIERHYKNHLKSETQTKNFYKRQRLNNSI